MKSILRIAALAVVLASILMSARHADGQSGSEMDLSASSQFGEGITFTAKLNSPIPIQNATLVIFDTSQGLTYSLPVAFDQNGVSEYHFDTSQISLRPFTTLLWRYDLTLADGSTTQSQTMSLRYDDNRFAWQDLESGPLRIHWYNGGDSFGVSAMNAAQAGLQSINNFFVPNLSEPVDIYIYASQNDLLGTLPGAESWIAGHADSPAGVVMVTIEPGANQNILMEQRIPHELMHVLLYRQVGDGYRNLPAWFREGMSVAAEVYPNPDHDSTLKDAAARDALIPILDLCDSLSPQADLAFLAYAESGSFINYLRGQFGSDGLMNLANTYASGVDCEPGMERAFNVPFARLERDWQKTLTDENSILSDLGDFAPYLVLLCLVMFFPLMGILGSMRKKGGTDGQGRTAGNR